jgi:Tfp pilus assembly PilM family ATPase
MFGFFSRPSVGIEITSASLRIGVLGGKSDSPSLLASAVATLPEGMVSENYAARNVKDPEALISLLSGRMREVAPVRTRRAGLSLPDGIFRVQTLDFDELPSKPSDRERLIRWRLEKSSAFDVSGTVLRYQASRRAEKGFSVIACVAKQDVLAQYEELIAAAGCEPWAVGPSSFHALNFYYPHLSAKSPAGFGLIWVTEAAYAVIIVERGGPRFYRFKEIKGASGDAHARLLREVDDSVHFYLHMDRQQQSGLAHLYLAGEPARLAAITGELKDSLALEIEAVSPDAVLATGAGAESLAAALGAGASV